MSEFQNQGRRTRQAGVNDADGDGDGPGAQGPHVASTRGKRQEQSGSEEDAPLAWRSGVD